MLTHYFIATTNNTEHVKDIKEHEPGNRELTQTSSLDRTDFDKIEQATSNIPNPKCTTEPHVVSPLLINTIVVFLFLFSFSFYREVEKE